MKNKIGHYAPYLIGFSLLFVIVLYPLNLPSDILLGIALIVVGFILYSWHRMKIHDHSQCMKCLIYLPDNPFAEAERRARQLKIVHLPQNRFLMYLGVLFLFDLLAIAYVNVVTYLLYILVNMSLLYLMRAHVSHKQLVAFCPKCGFGGIHPKIKEIALT